MPGTFCNVRGCKNNSVTSPDLSFFRIPKDKPRMKVWIHRIGREDILSKPNPHSYRVCAVHFSQAMFKIKRISPDAVPTLCLPDSPDDTQSTTPDLYPKKLDKKIQVDIIENKTANIKQSKPTAVLRNMATQTEFEYEKCQKCKLLPITKNLPTISAKTQREPNCSEDATPISHIAISKPISNTRTVIKRNLSKNVETKEVLTINTARKRNLKYLQESQKKRRKLENDFKNLANKLNHIRHASLKESKPKLFSQNRTSIPQKIYRMQRRERKTLLHSENLIDELFRWQNKLKSKYKGKRYHKEYKHFILNLYLISPQTYLFLEKSFNLPSIKTLQEMKVNFRAGVSDDLITILSKRLKNSSPNHRYCTICLDEMILKKNLHYDIKNVEFIGFQEIDGKKQNEIAGKAFVMLLRGCIENYKQPLGYAFTATNKNYKELSDWLDKIIKKLSNAGFVVCAVLSDQSPNFVDFAKLKGVSVEKPYFKVDDKKVFYIFDVPYLYKGICNNLLTCNFEYDDKKVACWDYIKTFYNTDKHRNIRMAPKLTDAHLKPNEIKRMKVQHAAQVLSHSVAAGMSCDIESGNLPANAQGTVDFISKVNNLFDILNSSKVSDHNKYKRALYGASYQLEYLKNSLDTFKNIRAINFDTKEDITHTIDVFTGLQVTINSILQLLDYFASEGVNYILTRRLNKDDTKHFFKAIRHQGVNSKKTTPILFLAAFSKIVFSSLFSKSSLTNYCEEDLDSFFLLKSNQDVDLLFKNNISNRPSPLFCPALL